MCELRCWVSRRRLLDAGWAVVFLHRRGSKQPFTHALLAHFERSVMAHGLALDEDAAAAAELNQRAAAEARARLPSAAYLPVEFLTLGEYLVLLRLTSTCMRIAGVHALILLCAAVSDFYIPASATAEHKLQSSITAGESASAGPGIEDGIVSLQLHPVPKFLGLLKSSWSPAALLISFKLETDEALLIPKAVRAIVKYGVHAVVANLLQTRYQQLTLVTLRARQHQQQQLLVPLLLSVSEQQQQQQHLQPQLMSVPHSDHVQTSSASATAADSSYAMLEVTGRLCLSGAMVTKGTALLSIANATLGGVALPSSVASDISSDVGLPSEYDCLVTHITAPDSSSAAAAVALTAPDAVAVPAAIEGCALFPSHASNGNIPADSERFTIPPAISDSLWTDNLRKPNGGGSSAAAAAAAVTELLHPRTPASMLEDALVASILSMHDAYVEEQERS